MPRKAANLPKQGAKGKKKNGSKAKAPTKPSVKKQRHEIAASVRNGEAGDFDACIQDKIFQALADVHAYIAEVPGIYVANAAGYSCMDSKPFRQNLKVMKDIGLVQVPSKGNLSLTETGKARLSLHQAPKTNASSLESLKHVLGTFASDTKASAICDLLSDGQARSREWLAQKLGLTSTDTKSFRNAVSTLNKYEMIETLANKSIQLALFVFPEGRP
jgi:hypothetical protein